MNPMDEFPNETFSIPSSAAEAWAEVYMDIAEKLDAETLASSQTQTTPKEEPMVTEYITCDAPMDFPVRKRTAAYSVFRGRGACKYSVLDFAKGPAAPLTPHTSRPLHPTAWPPFSTGALAGGVRGGGAEGADRA